MAYPVVEWIKQTAVMNSTSSSDNLPTIAVDSSGNAYVAYETGGTVSGGTFLGGNDVVVFKMNTAGTLLWIKQQRLMNGTPGFNNTTSISVDISGNVYVSYKTPGTVSGGTNTGSWSIVVFKMNTSGTLIWIKQQLVMNTTLADESPSISVDLSGNVYVSYQTAGGTVSGGTIAGAAGVNDIVVFKMDTNGNVLWIKQQPVMNTTLADTVPSTSVDSSGNVYVSYQSTGTVSGGSNKGSSDIVVFKMDTDGNVLWIKEQDVMNTILADTLPSISLDSSRNIYVSYSTTGTVSGGSNKGSNDIVVFKMDTDGNVLWIKEQDVMNSTLADTLPSTSVDSSGNVYVSYQSDGTVSGSSNKGSNDIVLLKMDTNGNIVWIMQELLMNTTSNDSTPSISIDSSGNVYVTYWTQGGTVSGSSNTDVWYDIVVFKITQTNSLISPNISLVEASKYNTIHASVSWLSKNGADSINVYRDTQISGDTKTLIGSSTSYSFLDTTLTESGTYYYFLSGVFGATVATPSSPYTYSFTYPAAYLSWIKQTSIMNTPLDDSSTSIKVDSSGNIYVAYSTSGTVSSGSKQNQDIVVFKMNTNGTLLWIKQQLAMNSTGDDSTPSMTLDLSGNIYVSYKATGTVSGGTKAGSDDIVVFKMNTNGNVLWIKQQLVMNTSGSDSATSISADSSGNVYVSYQTQGGTVSGGTLAGAAGIADIVVFKMNTSGTLLWIIQQQVMNTAGSDQGPKILVDSSGNVYVSYQTDGTVSGGTLAGSYDIVVFKMDTNGNVLWIKQQIVMNTILSDGTSSISVDSTGNIYVSYSAGGTVSGGTKAGSGGDIVVFKMDTNGTLLWIKQQLIMNSTTGGVFPFISIDSFDNIYVSYHTNGTVSGGTQMGNNEMVIFKMDSNGNIVWIKQEGVMNTTNTDVYPTMSFDLSGNIYVSYLTRGTVSGGTYLGGNYDVVVFKLIQPSTTTIPSAPTGLYTLTGDQQLDVVFTPGSNGGSQITNYKYSIDNGSTFAPFSPATGAVSKVTITTGLTNGQSYNIQLIAVNANGDGPASATTTGTPASAAAAVASGTVGIGNYISSQPSANDTQKANTTIDVRASIKTATYADNAAKAASQVAYIDAMRTQIGAPSYTLPSTEFTSFMNTFTSSAPGIVTKPVDIFYPTFASQTATVDVSATASSKYLHVEIPIGYSVTFQNGAATLRLTNNGSSYVDDSSTVYNVNTAFVLGNKTYNIIGIGSSMIDTTNDGSVVCLNEGTQILTPNGNVAIELLKKGDSIITGTNEVKVISNIHKIVVVNANENNAPYIIEKEAFGVNCPPNQLIVSPRHAIQLRQGLWEIPHEAAKGNKRVYQNKAAVGSKVIYYHITLPNYERDTLVANGQITEALNDGKVLETYVWKSDQGGYIRQTKPMNKTATQ